MSELDHTLEQRRARLAADIARQRTQLAGAYRDIAKPIQYFEYGMRGFGFLRQNPWVLSVVPAAFTITSAIVGMVRTPKPAPKLSLFEKISRGTAARKAAKEEKKVQRSVLGHAIHWGGRGMKLYGLYKKIRKFL